MRTEISNYPAMTPLKKTLSNSGTQMLQFTKTLSFAILFIAVSVTVHANPDFKKVPHSPKRQSQENGPRMKEVADTTI
ncbi:MAG: hypothetical protein M3Z56_04885, partial [Bacteroidota bacterium]|nr:hypothetical protein [Bacteroidota bacterium]